MNLPQENASFILFNEKGIAAFRQGNEAPHCAWLQLFSNVIHYLIAGPTIRN